MPTLDWLWKAGQFIAAWLKANPHKYAGLLFAVGAALGSILS